MSVSAMWSMCELPPALKVGDTVAVCAPAGPVVREDLLRGLAVLSSRYQVLYDEGLFARAGFLAGTDERRAEELMRYLDNPEVRAVFCARGGYGTMRILDRLDADVLARDPKAIVGFSDITALLAWAVSEAHVFAVHGPVVTQLSRLPAADVEWLFALLEGRAHATALCDGGKRVGDRGGGTVEGRLVGGNLEVVTRLVGTPWALDLGASVFLVEETNEAPYRVDRMLTQLRLGGALDGVRAVAVGEFVGCVAADRPSVDEVIDERLAAFGLPGVTGVPVGHGERNLAFWLGATCVVDLARGRLEVETGS